MEAGQWEDAGILANTPKSKDHPRASYRVWCGNTCLYGRNYRAIVVQSDHLDKRRSNKMEREFQKSKKAIDKVIKKESEKRYACPHDAQRALEALIKSHQVPHWGLTGQITELKTYARGRVKAGEERKVSQVEYCLKIQGEQDANQIAKTRGRAGCFVLISNGAEGPDEKISTPGYTHPTPVDCLRAYKEQTGVEQSFSFLKEPLIVNDVFLKKPSRIEALVLILLLSLLVWNLIQRSLRKSVQPGKPGNLKDLNKNKTQRPTTFILSKHFEALKLLRLGETRRLEGSPTDQQMAYLEALGLSWNLFRTPLPTPARLEKYLC
jgi:transposase